MRLEKQANSGKMRARTQKRRGSQTEGQGAQQIHGRVRFGDKRGVPHAQIQVRHLSAGSECADGALPHLGVFRKGVLRRREKEGGRGAERHLPGRRRARGVHKDLRRRQHGAQQGVGIFQLPQSSRLPRAFSRNIAHRRDRDGHFRHSGARKRALSHVAGLKRPEGTCGIPGRQFQSERLSQSQRHGGVRRAACGGRLGQRGGAGLSCASHFRGGGEEDLCEGEDRGHREDAGLHRGHQGRGGQRRAVRQGLRAHETHL